MADRTLKNSPRRVTACLTKLILVTGLAHWGSTANAQETSMLSDDAGLCAGLSEADCMSARTKKAEIKRQQQHADSQNRQREPIDPSAPPPPSRPPPPSVPPVTAMPKPARPRSDMTKWITASDHLPSRGEGRSVVNLTIGSDGIISYCSATGSADPELHSQACTVLRQRAQFFPATNTDGRPTVGSYRLVVQWEEPTRSPPSSPAVQ